MSFSMTGYGQSSLQAGGYKITFEVKSVNNRYCEVVLRMPRDWSGYEDMLRRKVQSYIKRGRVDVTINRESAVEAAPVQKLNHTLVRSYLAGAEALKKNYGLPGELTVRDILSMPGIMESAEEPDMADFSAAGDFLDTLAQGLESSLQSLMEMRAREGEFLARDIAHRLDRLEELHAEMLKLSPVVVLEYRDKLRQRLDALTGGTLPLDEHRLGMEIAIFADRSNIDEELTRLFSHFGQCRALLRSGEPSGRKLDFLVQEMNRETNTIASKCSHLLLANLTLEMKGELEKIREQAANLE
ncbi:YicC/YloC family endoribonuclease [Paenibacillus tengchongensis]|uniref:YicC/YloC family endoribonuclease n=1 Tax=Paenibacillus tengchongensis TaxID=2608684 RepID=UPI00124C3360|nr:YicC/YloC family endoribonuclease [Paenibacillus tengchongensis]